MPGVRIATPCHHVTSHHVPLSEATGAMLGLVPFASLRVTLHVLTNRTVIGGR